MWDLIIIGFWFAIGFVLLNFAFTLLIYILVAIGTGIGWVIEKAKGE